MNIYEYQAKRLFKQFGLPLLKGAVCYTPEEAVTVAEKIGGNAWVLKAQILSSERTKGYFKGLPDKKNGIRFVHSLEEVRQEAAHMLGQTLVTPQTGTLGQEVTRLYVEQYCEEKVSLYLSVFIDFKEEKAFFGVCNAGGSQFEQRLSLNPSLMKKYELDLTKPYDGLYKEAIAADFGLSDPKQTEQVGHVLDSLYALFTHYDAFKVEINPLTLTKQNRLVALDGRISVDPDALNRHKDLAELMEQAENPQAKKAQTNDFRYIKLTGNIGCIVNGSGMVMETLDILDICGGRASTILDIGTGAGKNKVATAFRTLLSEPDVEGIFVNIFGGSTRCDLAAQGLVSACREISIGMPLVVRMDGTNAHSGRRILEQSGLPFIIEETLENAAKHIVRAVEEIM